MAITLEWLNQHKAKVESYYSQRNKNIDFIRRLIVNDKTAYFSTVDGMYIPPREEEERLIPPRAWSIVRSYEELLFANSPVISIPAESTHQAQTQADQIEKILQAWLHVEDVILKFRRAVRNMLADGMGVLQIVFDSNMYRRGENPIHLYQHDPKTCFPWPGRRGWKFVIREYKLSVAEAEDEFPLSDSRIWARYKPNLQTDELTVVEYWDDTEFCVALQSTSPLKGDVAKEFTNGIWAIPPTEHGYGFLPFVILIGYEVPSRETGDTQGISVLYFIQHLILYLARLLSQQATITRREAAPIQIVKTLDRQPVQVVEGGQVVLTPEEDFGYIQPPPFSRSSSLLVEIINNEFQSGSLPDGLMGVASGLSGLALERLQQIASLRLGDFYDKAERGLAEVCSQALRLANKFVKKPIPLYGKDVQGRAFSVVLEPDVVRGVQHVVVHLSKRLPADIPALITMLLSLRQGAQPVLSARTVLEAVQGLLRGLIPQQVTEEEMRLLVEMMLLPGSPLAQAMALQAALEYAPHLAHIIRPTAPTSSPPPTLPGGQAIPGMSANVVASQERPFQLPNTIPSALQVAQQVLESSLLRTRGGSEEGEEVELLEAFK